MVHANSIYMYRRSNAARNSLIGRLIPRIRLTLGLLPLFRCLFLVFDVLVREHGAVKPDGCPCAELTMMMEYDADATVVVGRLVF